MPFTIREADPRDAATLSALAHRAKARWGYSDEWLRLWRGDLTISGEYLAAHRGFVALAEGVLIGGCVLESDGIVGTLEHVWIAPERQGLGVGRAMLRRRIREDIILTTALVPSVGTEKADPGQLEQLLMNLSVNAQDAMPQGGRLTIETGNVTLDETYNRMHPHVWPEEYVLLAVSDTGTGMDPQTKARVFAPFFTTQGAGKGTGLGLAVVHGVATQGEGHIEVDSEVGQGTAFKVYLPAGKERLEGGQSVPGLHPLPPGSETLLLVEDEDAVRALARRVLVACGYTVLEAADGRDAVRVAEGHAGRIDLLVSDVVMPHWGGRQRVERLTAVTPTALAQKVRDVLGPAAGH